MTTALARTDVVYVVANHGRWVAECIRRRPFICRDALQVHRGDMVYRCPTCALVAEIVWPAEAAMIEHLLSVRPDPATRNWDKGESVNYLLIENLAHGVEMSTTPEIGAAASRLVLDAETCVPALLDEAVTIDAMPAREIGA